MRIALAMAVPPAHDRERLLQSMQDLCDSLARLVDALQSLEARVARLNGPSLRVVRGAGAGGAAAHAPGFSPAAMTFVAGNGSGPS